MVCDEAKLDDRGCNGAPDFVVEILSASTASRDLREKLLLYERFGVKEYWIADLWSRTIRVHLYDNEQFAPAKIFTDNDLLFADIHQVNYGGRNLKIISKDNLIKVKKATGRLKDLADAEELEKIDGI
ncbi:MAG: Uma2 family endonuclease [Victivallaceae bacterium]|nr:Uma2 family endonuclease [Victivallaceae bacterium]